MCLEALRDLDEGRDEKKELAGLCAGMLGIRSCLCG